MKSKQIYYLSVYDRSFMITFYDARYPGFNVLKLRAKSGMPVAFADFEVCKSAFQGSVEILLCCNCSFLIAPF